jgi:hypothetical protein
MRHKRCRVLTLCLALAAPSFTAAQAPRDGAPETLASFTLPSLPDRPFALQFAGAVALFSLPDEPTRKAFPAVLILPDALGADGRAVPYVESLLGAGIAVLELRDASAEAARAALALLASDPRIEAPRLGVLGFGQGARLALGLPGADALALLYPGCASLPVPETAPGAVLLLHGAEDPANPAPACASLYHGIQKPVVPALPLAFAGWPVAEVMALVDYNQVVIGPVDMAKINVARQAALTGQIGMV